MVDKSAHGDCRPPLPPYKGGIFLREGKQEAEALIVWHHVMSTTWELSADAIPGECALLVPDHQIWAFHDNLWSQDLLGTEHVARCRRTGEFNALGVNYIDIPNPTEEAGIVFGGEDRREWTIGNWIAHLGGRINGAGYLEFGSVYAFHAMLVQMLRADFKGEEELRVTIDGGDDSMKVVVAMLLGSAMGEGEYTPGPNLLALKAKLDQLPGGLDKIKERVSRLGDTQVIIDTLPRRKG
ncbi:hypothetical protein AH06_109 [Erwinia phage AH06]|nr:hypothetical protein AH06_109 [Erwinia phage AH06]